MRKFALPLLLALGAPAALAANPAPYAAVTQQRLETPEPGNWLMYRRTYDSQGYSPLEQINAGNVANLKPLWTLSTGVEEAHQAPPIVNDGVMFLSTPRNQVIAVDARSAYPDTRMTDSFGLNSSAAFASSIPLKPGMTMSVIRT